MCAFFFGGGGGGEVEYIPVLLCTLCAFNTSPVKLMIVDAVEVCKQL